MIAREICNEPIFEPCLCDPPHACSPVPKVTGLHEHATLRLGRSWNDLVAEYFLQVDLDRAANGIQRHIGAPVLERVRQHLTEHVDLVEDPAHDDGDRQEPQVHFGMIEMADQTKREEENEDV